MKTIKGDLLKLADEGKFDIIVHGCNCFHAMGSGIALAIRNKYPQAFEEDCKTSKGNAAKLGTVSCAVGVAKSRKQFIIVNAYTQFHTATYPGQDVFEYDAFQRLLDMWAGADSPIAKVHLGFPMIGMGLAGGDSKRILSMIRKFDKTIRSRGGSVTMVEFG